MSLNEKKKTLYTMAVIFVTIYVVFTVAYVSITSGFPPKEVVHDFFKVDNDADKKIKDNGEIYFFVDNSITMSGYINSGYVDFIKGLRSYLNNGDKDIRISIFDFSNRLKTWEDIDKGFFYHSSNTRLYEVLERIKATVRVKHPKGFVILTDTFESSQGIGELLDAGLKIQLIAVMCRTFSGSKLSKDGSIIQFRGDSPLYFLALSFSDEFVSGFARKLRINHGKVEQVEFVRDKIETEIERLSTPWINTDGSLNHFKVAKNYKPGISIKQFSNSSSTIEMKVSFDAVHGRINTEGLKEKRPNFCGKLYEVSLKGKIPFIPIGEYPADKVMVYVAAWKSEDERKIEATYTMTFDSLGLSPKLIATDISLCNWVDAKVPQWLNKWSSDCDNTSDCYNGKTPFIKEVVTAVLNETINKHTFAYMAVKR
ncbi:MAG: VWA domain-containing protein [Nitrospirae bacterium]|nr:VWA domain-containing protein [Nitrospirota bacterium]